VLLSFVASFANEGIRGGGDTSCSLAEFMREYIWWDCGISDLSPLSGSTAAWMHVQNTREKRIAGERFIFDVGLGSGVGWSPVSSTEQGIYIIPPALVHILAHSGSRRLWV
jgi:hypothetical protein